MVLTTEAIFVRRFISLWFNETCIPNLEDKSSLFCTAFWAKDNWNTRRKISLKKDLGKFTVDQRTMACRHTAVSGLQPMAGDLLEFINDHAGKPLLGISMGAKTVMFSKTHPAIAG